MFAKYSKAYCPQYLRYFKQLPSVYDPRQQVIPNTSGNSSDCSPSTSLWNNSTLIGKSTPNSVSKILSYPFVIDLFYKYTTLLFICQLNNTIYRMLRVCAWILENSFKVQAWVSHPMTNYYNMLASTEAITLSIR